MITASPLSSLLPLEGVEKDRGKTRVRYTFSTPLWKSHRPRNDIDYHIVKQGDAQYSSTSSGLKYLSIKNKTSPPPHRSRIFTLNFYYHRNFFQRSFSHNARILASFSRRIRWGKIACISDKVQLSVTPFFQKKDKRETIQSDFLAGEFLSSVRKGILRGKRNPTSG